MMVWAIATVFVFAGLANLIGIRPVRRLYKRWDIPAATYRIIGVVELIAAAFLAQPDMRLWGIAIAAPIVCGAVILLLNHRHYAYATAVSLILAGFVPAMLAIPPSHAALHYVALS